MSLKYHSVYPEQCLLRSSTHRILCSREVLFPFRLLSTKKFTSWNHLTGTVYSSRLEINDEFPGFPDFMSHSVYNTNKFSINGMRGGLDSMYGRFWSRCHKGAYEISNSDGISRHDCCICVSTFPLFIGFNILVILIWFIYLVQHSKLVAISTLQD